MRIRPADSTLGAYIDEIELARLSESEWHDLQSALLEYAVLVFPNANLSTLQQERFSERFGKLEILTGNPMVKSLYVCNVDTEGNVLPLDDDNFRIVRGNEYWHTDSSYMPVAAKVSCLSALVTPGEGGRTEFTDMRSAYQALDSSTKHKISQLSAYHSFYRSQESLGQTVEMGSRYGFHRQGAPLRPLVKTHPDTGRRSLYVGRHAYRIPGMTDREATQLRDSLLEFACQPPRIFQHAWTEGDMVLWDNRCVVHRVRPYDYSQPRIMRHTRVTGDAVSEGAPTDENEQPSSYNPATT